MELYRRSPTHTVVEHIQEMTIYKIRDDQVPMLWVYGIVVNRRAVKQKARMAAGTTVQGCNGGHKQRQRTRLRKKRYSSKKKLVRLLRKR